MSTYVRTARELIARGMKRDKALLLVHLSFALTPDQIVRVAAEVPR